MRDVGHQLGRGALQHQVYGLEYVAHRLQQDFGQLGGGYFDGLGQAGDEVASLYLLHVRVGARDYAADGHLDLLGRLLADEHVVPAADVADYRLVKAGACGLYALALGHAAEGDDGGLGRAAADVDYQLAVGLADVKAGAVGRRDRALHQVDLARAGLGDGVDHGALLHARDAAGHADEDARLEQAQAGDALHQLAEHGDGHVVVGNDAADYGLDGHYAGGGAAEHLLRLLAHLHELARELVHGDQRRLAHLHALAAGVQQYAGGAHVEGDVFVKYRHSFTTFLPACGDWPVLIVDRRFDI